MNNDKKFNLIDIISFVNDIINNFEFTIYA